GGSFSFRPPQNHHHQDTKTPRKLLRFLISRLGALVSWWCNRIPFGPLQDLLCYQLRAALPGAFLCALKAPGRQHLSRALVIDLVQSFIERGRIAGIDEDCGVTYHLGNRGAV